MRIGITRVAAVMAIWSLCGMSQAQVDGRDAVEWRGHVYRFDEEHAVDRLWELAKILESRKGLPSPPSVGDGSNQHIAADLTQFPEIIEIGWVMVAIGSFGEGSDQLRDAIFYIKKKFGHLSVPYWVCTDEERKRLLLAAAQGPIEGVSDPMQNLGRFSRSLFHIADLVETSVSKRAGYQFEGYDGPIYSGF